MEILLRSYRRMRAPETTRDPAGCTRPAQHASKKTLRIPARRDFPARNPGCTISAVVAPRDEPLAELYRGSGNLYADQPDMPFNGGKREES